MPERITITADDLGSRKVEARLKEQEALARNRSYAQLDEASVSAEAPEKRSAATLAARLWYHPVVYMMLFGLVGGGLAWTFGTLAQLRPSAQAQAADLLSAVRQITGGDEVAKLNDTQRAAVVELHRMGERNEYFRIETDPALSNDQKQDRIIRLSTRDAWRSLVANILSYGLIGMMIALLLSVAEPVVDRNYPAAVVNGAVGATLGLLGGIVVSLFVDRLHGTLDARSGSAALADAVKWGVLGLFLTLAPGLVMRNARRTWIGAAAGLIGGIAGGLLFGPVLRLTDRPELGRLAALLIIGGLAGAATGLIENAAKTGWVRVIEGLIAGKQFILYRNPTFIGSGADCQIYLFRDPAVGRRHAAIHLVPGGFELENLPLGGPTLVNDNPVTRTRLRGGDRVRIGGTCFLFQEKHPAN